MGAKQISHAAMKDPGDNDDNRDGSGNTGTGIVTKTRPKTKKPSLYKVLLLNDDYTPMEFVVHILEKIFGKTREEAEAITRSNLGYWTGYCSDATAERVKRLFHSPHPVFDLGGKLG